jgi:hypothetical protein
MELEKQVADELSKNGYYIFYKNLRIIKNKYDEIAELDIVCSEFILEIKSGKYIDSKGIYGLMSHNILPNNFIYYFYCPLYSDSEIIELNNSFTNKHYKLIYINKLETVYNNHKPNINILVEDEKHLTRILGLTDSNINYINKLYMTFDTYSKTKSLLDYKSKFIQDIFKNIIRTHRLLSVEHKIHFIHFNDTTDSFKILKKQTITKLLLDKFKTFNLELYFRYESFENCKIIYDIESLYPK